MFQGHYCPLSELLQKIQKINVQYFHKTFIEFFFNKDWSFSPLSKTIPYLVYVNMCIYYWYTVYQVYMYVSLNMSKWLACGMCTRFSHEVLV